MYVCANNNVVKYLPGENLQLTLNDRADEIIDKIIKYSKMIEKNIVDNGFWLCKIYLVKELLASSFYLYNNQNKKSYTYSNYNNDKNW